MKVARQRVIGGLTVKVKTACGNMYVQMNWQDGKIFEVFATLGKSGFCSTSQSEALTRSITVGLRSGVPIEEYIRQLKDIHCPSPMPFPKEEAVFSCADALSRTLATYGHLSIDGVVKMLRKANRARAMSGPKEHKEQVVELEKERDKIETDS